MNDAPPVPFAQPHTPSRPGRPPVPVCPHVLGELKSRHAELYRLSQDRRLAANAAIAANVTARIGELAELIAAAEADDTAALIDAASKIAPRP